MDSFWAREIPTHPNRSLTSRDMDEVRRTNIPYCWAIYFPDANAHNADMSVPLFSSTRMNVGWYIHRCEGG